MNDVTAQPRSKYKMIWRAGLFVKLLVAKNDRLHGGPVAGKFDTLMTINGLLVVCRYDMREHS